MLGKSKRSLGTSFGGWCLVWCAFRASFESQFKRIRGHVLRKVTSRTSRSEARARDMRPRTANISRLIAFQAHVVKRIEIRAASVLENDTADACGVLLLCAGLRHVQGFGGVPPPVPIFHELTRLRSHSDQERPSNS